MTVNTREKLYDEAVLRSRTREHAKALYEKRWGRLTEADSVTLDVQRWQAAWAEAAKAAKVAQRHLSKIRRALADAARFAAGRPSEAPMGESEAILVHCVPLLQRTIDVAEQSYGLSVNPADRPTRSVWIRRRLLESFYKDARALADAEREELAVLSIMGGWWPPAADDSLPRGHRGAPVRMYGKSVENVLALEGDLMARARETLQRQQQELEELPVAKLVARMMATLLSERKVMPRGASVRSLEAHGALDAPDTADTPRRGDVPAVVRPRDRAPHRRTRRV